MSNPLNPAPALFRCVTVEDTQALAAKFARSAYQLTQALPRTQTMSVTAGDVPANKGIFIALEGDLGAGKTCFSQGFIQALLPTARVKSPTYTLIESYPLPDITLYHLDLYRIHDPEELEYLGLREFFWHNLCLIEWASRAEGWLPEPDLRVQLKPYEGYHQVLGVATSAVGAMLLSAVSAQPPSL